MIPGPATASLIRPISPTSKPSRADHCPQGGAMLTEAHVEHWRQLWKEATADASWVTHNQEVDGKRTKVRSEVASLLDRYLRGEVETEELQATFDRRTRTDWEGFGFKGLSGAMFLN